MRSRLFSRRTLVFVAFVVATLTISSVNVRMVKAFPTSNMLKVSWHSQFESNDPFQSYFCAVADVQMVLQYISGKVVPQPTLAKEMKTSPECEGTCYWNIHIPFDNRNYTTKGVQNSTLDDLKSLNAQGYVSIIDIWGDDRHTYGHYLVVVGYDQNGIYVNDPGTRIVYDGTGAFISNSKLADRWKHNQWVLQIPYPALKSESITSKADAFVPGQALLTAAPYINTEIINSTFVASAQYSHSDKQVEKQVE